MNESKIKNKKAEDNNIEGLAWLLSNKHLFFIHTFIYAAVNGLLILIWIVTFNFSISEPMIFWPFYSILGWLIGYGFHAVTYFMYNDKIESLSIARKKGNFAILYIYHAWFYASVNILIIFSFIMIMEYLLFLWLLSLWGVGFAIHSIGFFTWDSRLNVEKKYFKSFYPEASEEKLGYLAGLKIIQFWLLIGNVAYFIVSLILIYIGPLYGVEYMVNYINGIKVNPIYQIIPYAIFIAIHGLSFYLFNYKLTMELIKSSLLLDLIAYIAFNVYFIILQILNPYQIFPRVWIHFPLILWGIILGIHYFLTYRWDKELKGAMETLKNSVKKEIDEFELKRMGIVLLFFEWTFIAHLSIYIVGVVLISIELISLEIANVIIYVVMGWLIAVDIHGALFIVYYKQIRAFLSWTAVVHAAIYITVGIFLVIMNVTFSPGVAWSAIAIGGWGIGFGLHVLLAYLVKNR